jgi:hypothetical protein
MYLRSDRAYSARRDYEGLRLMTDQHHRTSANNWLGWSAIILSTFCGLLLSRVAVSSVNTQQLFAGILHCTNPAELWQQRVAYGLMEPASATDTSITCRYGPTRRATFSAAQTYVSAHTAGLGIGCGVTYAAMAAFALILAGVRTARRWQRSHAPIPTQSFAPLPTPMTTTLVD